MSYGDVVLAMQNSVLQQVGEAANSRLDTGDWIQIGVGVVLTLTLVFVWRYAKDTYRMAKIAHESALCPVIEQFIDKTEMPRGAVYVPLVVKYQNTGNGPAVLIRCGLYDEGGGLIAAHQRIGMGAREPKAPFEFNVDVDVKPNSLLVRTEYESVLGVLWQSSLSLKPETINGKSYLVNGVPGFKRISERTVPEKEQS